MGRPVTLAQLRQNFEADIVSARNLVTAIRPLGTIHTARTPRSIHIKQVYRVVELAFLGVVSEWESFIEETFVRYLTGAQPASGNPVSLSAGKAISISHSYEIISQNADYDNSKHYLRFSDPKWTLSQARFFFSRAGTYSCIHANLARLQEAAKLRNRAAHNSVKCKADFKVVALSYINPPSGKLTKGYRLGELLSQPALRHFGITSNNVDYLEAFFRLYSGIAKLIVP
ncbi:MAG: hypothetical protein EOP06_03125 [Proteobacteria bacterium]|nr:MAG: hypothetical protein EOP06_03125 [Pseudomonadota bacterium]